MAKKPIPTVAKPQPATSSYLNAPKAIKINPINIIIKVAQASTVFLFIPIFQIHLFEVSPKKLGEILLVKNCLLFWQNHKYRNKNCFQSEKDKTLSNLDSAEKTKMITSHFVF